MTRIEAKEALFYIVGTSVIDTLVCTAISLVFAIFANYLLGSTIVAVITFVVFELVTIFMVFIQLQGQMYNILQEVED